MDTGDDPGFVENTWLDRRVVAREHRIPVFDLGRLACVGVYLAVHEPGGDPSQPRV